MPIVNAEEPGGLQDVAEANVVAVTNGHSATCPWTLIRSRIIGRCRTGGLVMDPLYETGPSLAVAADKCARHLDSEITEKIGKAARKALCGAYPALF